MRFRKVFRQYWLSISWGFFILLLTGIPGQFLPQVPRLVDLFRPDKLVHLFIFGVFVIALMRGFSQEPGFALNRYLLYSSLISLSFGGITELLQAYVFINRQGSFLDFIADGIGCILGYLLYKYFRKLSIKG
ncbi:MAG: VanZ family protein [Bacteroidetes bacterium]|nr:VanZ family protein [Bacteroidota bacterium]